MKFSTLMSIYKKEDPVFLQEALSSIWNEQLLKPSEIILVEDGGLTSELYQVLDAWSKSLPNILKRIPLPENVGLGNALNEGFKHCSHEWIFRMDTDDICTPERFEKQIEFIKNHPDIDIFSSQIIEFDSNVDDITGTKKVPLSHNDILKFVQWRSPFNHMAVAYKKSVIEDVGGYQHHQLMEDYNLWLRVLAGGYKSANLKEALVLVRAGEAMVKRRRGWVYMKSEWQLFKLKQELNFQPTIPAFFIFLVRFSPRILPSIVLVKIYARLRAAK